MMLFLAGAFVGTMFGVLLMALMNIASDADDRMEDGK